MKSLITAIIFALSLGAFSTAHAQAACGAGGILMYDHNHRPVCVLMVPGDEEDWD